MQAHKTIDMRKNYIITLMAVSLMTSCYYDKENELYGTSTCVSTSSTYSGTVAPILNQRCNACHSGAAANSSGGGIVLDNHPSVKNYVTNGKLLGSINHASGYSPMPKGSTKLSACEIAKITDWANNGAPNN